MKKVTLEKIAGVMSKNLNAYSNGDELSLANSDEFYHSMIRDIKKLTGALPEEKTVELYFVITSLYWTTNHLMEIKYMMKNSSEPFDVDDDTDYEEAPTAYAGLYCRNILNILNSDYTAVAKTMEL